MQKDVVQIDEARCDGCGKCISACSEGALTMVNGKARLVSEFFCDGLGICIAKCPVGAISLIRKDVAEGPVNKADELFGKSTTRRKTIFDATSHADQAEAAPMKVEIPVATVKVATAEPAKVNVSSPPKVVVPEPPKVVVREPAKPEPPKVVVREPAKPEPVKPVAAASVKAETPVVPAKINVPAPAKVVVPEPIKVAVPEPAKPEPAKSVTAAPVKAETPVVPAKMNVPAPVKVVVPEPVKVVVPEPAKVVVPEPAKPEPAKPVATASLKIEVSDEPKAAADKPAPAAVEERKAVTMEEKTNTPSESRRIEEQEAPAVVDTGRWPLKIRQTPADAPYFDNARLLIAADCAAFARARFHEEYMKDRVTLIGCPKFDTVNYAEKLSEIIRQNNIRNITLVRMEASCCRGLERALVEALISGGKMIPWQIVTFGTDGSLLED